ncbi:MAG: DMT family transporter [Lautropia sp.]|nr:DMT family transporter [Lautropia sp.]
MNLTYGLIALATGIGMAMQAAINARLSAGLGYQPLVASLISFSVGTIFLAVAAFFLSDWQPVAANIGQQPWWRWLGGLLGAGFVTATVFMAPKIGIVNMMFLIIIGQLCTGMLIDHFGLIQMPVRPVPWWKLAGMGVMLVGLVIFMFGDRFIGQNPAS